MVDKGDQSNSIFGLEGCIDGEGVGMKDQATTGLKMSLNKGT